MIFGIYLSQSNFARYTLYNMSHIYYITRVAWHLPSSHFPVHPDVRKPSFFGGQHCCSRCKARAARTHVEKIKHRHRPGSAFHDTPLCPRKGSTTRRVGQRWRTWVRWEPKKLLPVPLPLPLLAMGTNRARSLLVFLTESLERHAGHYRRIYSRSLNLFKIKTVFLFSHRKERLLKNPRQNTEILFSSFNKKMKMTIILQMLTQYSFYLIYWYI